MQVAEQLSGDIVIHLPDGSTRTFEGPVTGYTLAENISKSLAKKALAVKVNGELRDLSRALPQDAAVEIITKDNTEEALELIRHDCAHVMAEAVQKLYPGTQVTIGPAISTGFYYDFARDVPFTPEDLETIEAEMRRIIEKNEPFTREVWDRDDAIKHFTDIGETYKAEIIRDLPETETVTIYRQGSWMDLCRGPHLPSTGKIGTAFKLMSIAGAYWRGNSDNEMLQRIYGTAWVDAKQLKAHLTMLEEAEKRDHRRLGKELDLFHFQEEAAGSCFWHPKGWRIWLELENYIRTYLREFDYQEVKTPQLIDKSLFKASGHWDMYGDNMYKVQLGDDKEFGIKPMNCPAHVQIFKQGLKSYRDLPLRLAEFGCCHRNEASGALHGLMRVRQMTQDDAHIFCTDEQIQEEALSFCDLLSRVYKGLGFTDVRVVLATRPEKRAGSEEVWDRAEAGLEDALKAAGLDYQIEPGEGAFYGPKLEFHLTDAIGRSWQCGTLQLDFILPERLDASYIAETGEKKRPVMLHRAILGSLERFIGILIENYAGKLPMWLQPTQVVVATITGVVDDYALEVTEALEAAGIRAESDLRNEKINLKVREHSLQKVPVLLVVGERERDDRKVAIRRLGSKAQEVMSLDDALEMLKSEAAVPFYLND